MEAFFLSVVYHARVCVATTSTSLTVSKGPGVEGLVLRGLGVEGS